MSSMTSANSKVTMDEQDLIGSAKRREAKDTNDPTMNACMERNTIKPLAFTESGSE